MSPLATYPWMPFVEGGDNSLLDVLRTVARPARTITSAIRSREIERSLSTLTDRQCDVIKLYFGIGVEHPMSLEDIGDKFTTRERTSVRSRTRRSTSCAFRDKLLPIIWAAWIPAPREEFDWRPQIGGFYGLPGFSDFCTLFHL